jgi:nitrite transporter
MPIPVPEAVDEAGALARTKADQARNLPRYAIASMLAGAYVGVAVVLLISVGAPLVSAASPFSKLIQGAVFGVALTLVVFAGAELFTGNTMTMLQGLVRRDVRLGDLVVVWVSSLIGNFVGSIAFAAAVYQSGALTIGATPGKASPAQALLGSIVQGKDAASGGQLFWRAVLCSLAALDGSGTWSMLFRNLEWTVPGNIVGGALVVGGSYAWLGAKARAPEPATPVPAADPSPNGQELEPVTVA